MDDVIVAVKGSKPDTGFIFVHFSGSFRHTKVRFFELGNFQTELDNFLR